MLPISYSVETIAGFDFMLLSMNVGVGGRVHFKGIVCEGIVFVGKIVVLHTYLFEPPQFLKIIIL